MDGGRADRKFHSDACRKRLVRQAASAAERAESGQLSLGAVGGEVLPAEPGLEPVAQALSPNEDSIRATWQWLGHAAHGVSEVRVIGGRGQPLIGYFDAEAAFVSECVRGNALGNVYVGIQPRPRRMFDLAPNRLMRGIAGGKAQDIETLTALVVDLDPKRPTKTGSTDAEVERALKVAAHVAEWCEREGLVRPRVMMSGNGAHLWFALPPTSLAADGVLLRGAKAFQSVIESLVSDPAIKVDSIHDAPRVIKVIGTVSVKGDGAGERPHRVSYPVADFERVEDGALLERLRAEPPARAPSLPSASRTSASPARVSLPVVPSEAPPASCAARALRTEDGQYDWQSPVEMCSPVQRLWDEGLEDRSLAIFNMVRLFAHKQLPLEEITDLILEYDRRGLGKLQGRDGAAYVRHAYEKIVASAEEGGAVPPPCHSLQSLGLCFVNRDPSARCELYDVVFDIETALEKIPPETPAREIERRLKPILSAISFRDPAVHGRYLGLIEKRFGLKSRDLRQSLKRARGDAVREASPAPEQSAREEGLDGEVHQDLKFYYTQSSSGQTTIISSFVIEPTARVYTEEGEVIKATAHTDSDTTVGPLELPLSAFHSKRDFIRHLPSADLQWTGSDNNVQGLLRLLARRPVPRRKGTHMLGEYEIDGQYLWLGPDSVIGPEGFMDQAPVTFVSNGGSLHKRLKYEATDDETFRRLSQAVFTHLPKVNTPEVMLPIIGWFFATPFKARFMARVRSFPSLFVSGTAGSGKSSLVLNLMWPLFGITASEAYSATETEFALLKVLTATRSVPVFIDEYKSNDMARNRLNTLHRYMRRMYNGETEERGRPDQRLNTYRLQAPVCFAGENRPTETAILERMITSNPTKTTLTDSRACEEAYSALLGLPLALFAPRYIQFCLKRDFDADLALARQVTRSLIGERTATHRVRDNITAMLFGVHLFEEFAKECGAELEDLPADRAVTAMLDDLIESEHGVKNAFDHFVEMLGVMATQGMLKHRIHYAFTGGRLAIHLETAYDAFRAHCKQINYEGELLDLKALRRMAIENKKQKGFVVAVGERVYFNGMTSRRRAVVIDFDRTKAITPEDFPQHEVDHAGVSSYVRSRWGGDEPS
jgi:hypothetical protein